MRFISSSVAFVLVTVVALSAVPAMAEAPMAEKIPAGALVYVGWAGKTPAFDQSMLGQLIGDSGLANALAAAKTAMKDEVPPKDHAALERLWSAMDIAWRHPGAMALLDVRRDRKSPADLLVVVDLGKDRDAFAGHLDALIQSAVERKHLTVEPATAGGATYQLLRTKDEEAPAMAVGYAGPVFFLAVGPGVAGKFLALTPEASLREDKGFQAAHKEVAAAQEQVAFHIDVAALTKKAKAMSAASRPADEPAASQPVKDPAEAIVEALGISKVTTVAGSVGIVDKNLLTQVRMVTPAPHKGLLMPLAGGPLGDEALEHVPADAHMAAAGALSLSAFYAELRAAAKAADEDAEKALLKVEKRIQKQLGLSLTEEILPAFGDTWVVASAPSWGGVFTGTLLTVTVKDPAKAAAVMAKLEEYLSRQLAPPPAATRPQGPDADEPAPQPRRPRRSWSIEQRQVGGTTIKFVVRHGEAMPIAPAWAIHGGRLYVALWPQVIESAIAGTKADQNAGAAGKRMLADTGEFRALKNTVGKGASGLVYLNGAAVAKDIYNFILVGWTMGAGELSREMPTVRQDWLPALSTLEKYLQPEMVAVAPDAGGITFRAQSSLGVLSGAAVVLPTAAAVAVPALGGVREQAQKSASASNLHTIGMCCSMYVAQNEGRTPPSLEALVTASIMPAHTLSSPAGGSGDRARLEDGKIVGRVDYVYIPGLDSAKAADPSRCVWAYERPENFRNEGTNVLFLDGHVAWMPMRAFRRALTGGDNAPASRPAE